MSSSGLECLAVACLVVLGRAADKDKCDHHFSGAAVGHVMVAGAGGVGAVTGVCFKSAVASGANVASIYLDLGCCGRGLLSSCRGGRPLLPGGCQRLVRASRPRGCQRHFGRQHSHGLGSQMPALLVRRPCQAVASTLRSPAASLAAASGWRLAWAAGVGAGIWPGGSGPALSSGGDVQGAPRRELRLPAVWHPTGASGRCTAAAWRWRLLLCKGRCQPRSGGRRAGRPATGRTGQCEATFRLSSQMSGPCPTCTLQLGPHRM